MGEIIEFKINGLKRRIEVEPNELLINMIREKLGLTGTKYGCGIGECGSCTVLIDGEPALSCLTLAIEVNGREIVTIEGIAENELNNIQEAFLDQAAVQCGFCTPGMIIMAKYLLKKKRNPTEKEIKEYIKGNLCRCTGYINIVKAIKRAAEKMRGNNDKAIGKEPLRD